MRLGSGSPAVSCRQLSRRTAAVLHLTALRGDAFAALDGYSGRPPGVPRRRERTSGRDHQPVGGQDPGAPGYLATRCMPGVGAGLVFGASSRDRTVPAVSRGRGSPVTSEGHGHSSVLGRRRAHPGRCHRAAGTSSPAGPGTPKPPTGNCGPGTPPSHSPAPGTARAVAGVSRAKMTLTRPGHNSGPDRTAPLKPTGTTRRPSHDLTGPQDSLPSIITCGSTYSSRTGPLTGTSCWRARARAAEPGEPCE